MFELLDFLLAGMDQPQADQPNRLAERLPGNRDTLTQKSRESPPPQSYKYENANGDLEGYWTYKLNLFCKQTVETCHFISDLM
eukprot:1154896-Pelagomonas_calceolata.AAC.2